MGTAKRTFARFGVDNNSNTLTNVADPVNAQDAATKNFSINASNLSTGTVAAARMPAFSGDFTTTAGSTVATLSNSGVTAGTYGSATQIPGYSVDSKGRITGVTLYTVSATVGASGVTAGTYGSATQSASFTVGSDGRITSASVANIVAMAAYGGAAGSLLYQSGVSTTAFLAAGADQSVLQYNTAGSAPSWVSTTGTGSVVRASSPAFQFSSMANADAIGPTATHSWYAPALTATRTSKGRDSLSTVNLSSVGTSGFVNVYGDYNQLTVNYGTSGNGYTSILDASYSILRLDSASDSVNKYFYKATAIEGQLYATGTYGYYSDIAAVRASASVASGYGSYVYSVYGQTTVNSSSNGVYGMRSDVTVGGAAAVPMAYGLAINGSTMSTGSITDYYTIRGSFSLLGGAVTNKYGVYMEASVGKNYFGSGVQIGGSASSTVTYALDVNGQVNNTTSASGDVGVTAGARTTTWTPTSMTSGRNGYGEYNVNYLTYANAASVHPTFYNVYTNTSLTNGSSNSSYGYLYSGSYVTSTFASSDVTNKYLQGYYGDYLDMTVSGTTAYPVSMVGGTMALTTNNSGQNVSTQIGYRHYNSNYASVTTGYGYQTRTYVYGGTTSAAYGVSSEMYVYSGATAITTYLFYGDYPTLTGSASQRYGIYINNATNSFLNKLQVGGTASPLNSNVFSVAETYTGTSSVTSAAMSFGWTVPTTTSSALTRNGLVITSSADFTSEVGNYQHSVYAEQVAATWVNGAATNSAPNMYGTSVYCTYTGTSATRKYAGLIAVYDGSLSISQTSANVAYVYADQLSVTQNVGTTVGNMEVRTNTANVAGVVTSLAGCKSGITLNSGANVSSLYGERVSITVNTGATVQNSYVFYGSNGAGGTMTNKYGLYLDSTCGNNFMQTGLQVGGTAPTGLSQAGVGIGKAATGTDGVLSALQSLRVDATTSTSYATTRMFINAPASQTATLFEAQVNSSTRFVVDVNGSVSAAKGVGSADAIFDLGATRTVDGNAYIDLQAQAGGAIDYNMRLIRFSGVDGHAKLTSTGAGDLYLQQEGTGNILFVNGSSERGRVKNNGDWYIGTGGNTAPSTTGSTAAYGFAYGSTGSTNYLSFCGNGNTNMYMSKVSGYSNATMIGFYVAGTVVGSITITGSSTAYNTTSDSRLKENIGDAPSATTLLSQVQVRQFDWKATGEHQRYGVVAQELHAVFPEAVYVPTNEDEMMAVDYSKLVPMLVKALQETRAENASLAERLAALEAKLA